MSDDTFGCMVCMTELSKLFYFIFWHASFPNTSNFPCMLSNWPICLVVFFRCQDDNLMITTFQIADQHFLFLENFLK